MAKGRFLGHKSERHALPDGDLEYEIAHASLAVVAARSDLEAARLRFKTQHIESASDALNEAAHASSDAAKRLLYLTNERERRVENLKKQRTRAQEKRHVDC